MPASDLKVSVSPADLAALLRHAEYSFQPIDWDYSFLTPSEQSLISPEEFEAIRKMVASPVPVDETGR